MQGAGIAIVGVLMVIFALMASQGAFCEYGIGGPKICYMRGYR